MQGFFKFPRCSIIQNEWGKLSLAGKAVLPPIALHCFDKDSAFPGRLRLATVCDLPERMIESGIKDLKAKRPWVFKILKWSRDGNHTYGLTLPKRGEKNWFPFSWVTLESGVWFKLKPVARALYPVMCGVARADQDVYEHLQEEEFDDWQDYYDNRLYDTLQLGDTISNINDNRVTKTLLAGLAEISYPSLYVALQDLEDNRLIESVGNEGWKVYPRPRDGFRYDPRELNDEVREKYLANFS